MPTCWCWRWLRAWVLAQMDLRGARNMRLRLRGFLRAMLGPKARLRIFLVVMVIALVLTRSRMGNAAFFAALTLVGLFALWRLRGRSRPLVVLVVSVLIIDVFMVGTWFGVEQVIDRIQRTVRVEQGDWVVQDRTRIDVDRESLGIIRRAPLAGWGGGTFYTVYPAWRGDDQLFMDHAHNDYLEFAVEYGLVGLALLAGGAVFFAGGSRAGGPRPAWGVRYLVLRAAGADRHADPRRGGFQPADPGQRDLVRGAVPVAVRGGGKRPNGRFCIFQCAVPYRPAWLF